MNQEAARCPCNSGLAYYECCEPFHTRSTHAPTPEALMRSRYSAYTLANIDYIQSTMYGRAAQDFDARQAKDWAQAVDWHGLTVMKTYSHPTDNARGFVEYFASFSQADKKLYIHEISEFEFIDGRWYYTDGRSGAIGRNEPCPCQSGRKFKHCCAR